MGVNAWYVSHCKQRIFVRKCEFNLLRVPYIVDIITLNSRTSQLLEKNHVSLDPSFGAQVWLSLVENTIARYVYSTYTFKGILRINHFLCAAKLPLRWISQCTLLIPLKFKTIYWFSAKAPGRYKKWELYPLQTIKLVILTHLAEILGHGHPSYMRTSFASTWLRSENSNGLHIHLCLSPLKHCKQSLSQRTLQRFK